MIILYNILLFVGIFLSLPVIVVKMLTDEKKRRTFFQRLGGQGFACVPATRPMWVHALSVGEVLASAPLVKKISKARPGLPSHGQ